MGLYELFFSEASDAESLSRIAKSHERNSHIRERESVESRQQNYQVDSALANLENDVGTLALILAAILKMLDEKGQINREDLKEKLKELDLLDGVRDGKINVNDLREGSFF
jgi:hypothetical protein